MDALDTYHILVTGQKVKCSVAEDRKTSTSRTSWMLIMIVLWLAKRFVGKEPLSSCFLLIVFLLDLLSALPTICLVQMFPPKFSLFRLSSFFRVRLHYQ